MTAGIRVKFAAALQSTAFLDSAIVAAARTACRMSTKELRAKKDGAGASSTYRVPEKWSTREGQDGLQTIVGRESVSRGPSYVHSFLEGLRGLRPRVHGHESRVRLLCRRTRTTVVELTGRGYSTKYGRCQKLAAAWCSVRDATGW